MFQIALLAVAANKVGLQRVKGAARVAAYVGGLAFVGMAVGVHQAHAAIDNAGLRVGSDLAEVAPLLQGGSTIAVNGQRVHMGTAHSLEGKKAILDKFEAACQAGNGADKAPVWTSIPDNPEDIAKMNAGKLNKLPVLRQEEGNGGYIACLVPLESMTTDSFKQQVKDFVEKHASLKVGKLRYATVQEKPEGSSVISVWTDENFDLSALLPNGDHDTPGFDPLIMQRPPSTVRMLSGAVEQLPYKVFLYSSKQSPTDLIGAYDKQMFAAGWVSVQPPQSMGVPHQGFEARAYMRDGFVGYLTASTSPKGDTLVGVAETAGEPPATQRKTPGDADGF